MGRRARSNRRSSAVHTGFVLTAALVAALVGTVILTFGVALSSSLGGSANPTTTPSLANLASEIVSPTAAAVAQVDTASLQQSAQQDVAAPEGVTAKSAYAWNTSTGAALVALNPDERRATASLAKMMTGLVVADAVNNGLVSLDDEVVIEDSDTVDPNVFSHMGLIAGDTVSVQQLIEGMLIPSGNDAARALARFVGSHLAGDESVDPTAAFVEAMNATVNQLGLQETHFSNPDGDDDPDNYSTAHDLAVIGQQVMESDLLSGITSTPSITFTSLGPEQRSFQLFNTNQLLVEQGVDGVKTGTTGEAGACLVASTRLANGDRVIVVVLGSDPDPTDPETDPMTWPRFADTNKIFEQISATTA
jgi:D-alanyl-D-alanine carboxypeptidase (penicillin-binding protein 5/6)